MMEVSTMVDQDRDMEIIALISNVHDGYTYINSDKEVIEHACEVTGERSTMELIELEYFKDGRALDDKANFCEHCKQVFIYKK